MKRSALPFCMLALMLVLATGATGQCLHPFASVSLGDPYGDLDGSGALSVTDVQCAVLATLWELAGGVDPVPPCLAGPTLLADLLCDGTIDVGDVLLVVSLTLGIPVNSAIDTDGDSCPDNCAPPIVRRASPQGFHGVAVGGGYKLRNAPLEPATVGTSIGGGYQLRGRPIQAIPAPVDPTNP